MKSQYTVVFYKKDNQNFLKFPDFGDWTFLCNKNMTKSAKKSLRYILSYYQKFNLELPIVGQVDEERDEIIGIKSISVGTGSKKEKFRLIHEQNFDWLWMLIIFLIYMRGVCFLIKGWSLIVLLIIALGIGELLFVMIAIYIVFKLIVFKEDDVSSKLQWFFVIISEGLWLLIILISFKNDFRSNMFDKNSVELLVLCILLLCILILLIFVFLHLWCLYFYKKRIRIMSVSLYNRLSTIFDDIFKFSTITALLLTLTNGKLSGDVSLFLNYDILLLTTICINKIMLSIFYDKEDESNR